MSVASPTTDLTVVTAFADLPADVLDWLHAHGEIQEYPGGTETMTPGEPIDYMLAVLHGGVQYFSVQNGQREPKFRATVGQITGLLPYSRLQAGKGYGVTLGDTTIYRLHRDQFAALESVSPELVQRLVGMMSDRARDEARSQERDDKLRALGKLSAGLAHELNNPAAAIARAVANLSEQTAATPTLLRALGEHCLDPAALIQLTALATATPIDNAIPMSALDCADREDELVDWLEEQGVPDGYALAASLLEAELAVPELTAMAEQLPQAARPAAFAWLAGHLTTQRLLRDIQEAGSRITQLVTDVKTYSHMDRGTDYAPVDVTAGLRSTLNILSYPLRHKNITVVREFASDLPRVHGQASSLNQVWTNLLDNAIDALPDKGGEITLRTRLENGFVQVCVIDNGPGIPADVLPRIFEPFFSTKQAGAGSGLGLDIAQRIIANHNGKLEVTSTPGHTEFCAWLPV
ncbi:ATP-binding protein [Hymenobacter aerilatus]|uniref:histidine kinase n=1 Tax=Hymenobacter aerilatus TaxID=2932251 RepID=A0A8T9STK4_9BACT|nr:ATP-binding protein [Hymenobacter aerilatus]UOR05067.1 ATP-binding protein [Hymenobacter aerilatus]